MKVLILEGCWPTLMPEGPKIEQRVLGADTPISCVGEIAQKDYETTFQGVTGVITRPGSPCSAEMIRAMKQVKVIVSLGTGFDHIDIHAARLYNIPVCNIRHYCSDEVAETTVGLILALQRKLFLYHMNATWDWKLYQPIQRSTTLRVGIIGLGSVGEAVAKRLKPFGYHLFYYDPFKETAVDGGIQKIEDRDELISTCDVVTLHCPLTAQTRGMVNSVFLSRLKPNAILINTARGGLFQDEDSLFAALKNRADLRVGCDGLPIEPPGPHPLLEAWRAHASWLKDRLLVVPHSAFYSQEALGALREKSAELVKVVLTGNKPLHVVNESL